MRKFFGGGNKAKKPSKEELEKQQKTRHRIATEILETELSYVKSLQDLCKDYLRPLQDPSIKKPILKPEETKAIFSVIEAIATFNEALAGELQARMKNWGPNSCVGDIFVKNSAYLKMYSTYVNGMSTSMSTLSKCKQNANFVAFLEKAKESSTSRLDLQSYLIMPVQRLPRYVLLLTELLKQTQPTHPGYAALKEALDKVKEVADFVNEAKRAAENSLEVLSIQDSLTGKKFSPIFVAHRRFDSKGTIIYYSARKDFKPKTLHYFLFNDLLVLCWPPQSSKYRVKEVAYLYSCDLEEVGDSKACSNVVRLKATEDYLLGFATPEEKEKWTEHYFMLRFKSKPRREVSEAKLRESAEANGVSASAPATPTGSTERKNSKLFSKLQKSSSTSSAPASPAQTPPGSPKEALHSPVKNDKKLGKNSQTEAAPLLKKEEAPQEKRRTCCGF